MRPKWPKIEDELILGPTGLSSACGLDIVLQPQFLALWASFLLEASILDTDVSIAYISI